ncbi:MAG TPA: xanthine dehydrogenase family protein molybdopterin-binding subunit [Dictyobacter sp.]|jgi:CO/xanthine dehydrogenase Mo-binding subunit|nr:xanthine dehydrogenase family protein molybdopterin-binding subunit [Dictyobacter sp.]
MAQTAEQMTDFTAVGKPTRRIDSLDKLTGMARYAGDLVFPGLLHARLVLSPYAHARIVEIDTAAAEAIPGVVAIYTSETLRMAQMQSSSRIQSPLAQNEVFWCGHPVAVVLGETEAAAEDGALAVDVDYDPLPVVLDPQLALQPGSPEARSRNQDENGEIAGGGAHADVGASQSDEEEQEELSSNVCDSSHMQVGDIEAGWREAAVIVERTYRTHAVHQSYMEPQSITVVPAASGRELTVYPSTQAMMDVRSDIAKALDMPARTIHVESLPIGGAFGGKFGLSEPLAAAVAHAVRKPVRLVYTRQEDLLAGNPAPQTVITVKLGARRDGTLVALQGKVIFDSGAYPGAGARLGGFILNCSYRCPNVDIRTYEVITNKAGVGAYRAPGAPQITFALESTVDELCRQLPIDPVAFRMLNGLSEGDPTHDPRRPQFPPIGLLECLAQVEQHPLWKERAQKQVEEAELAGWKLGTGIAVGGWPGGTEPAAAACRLETDGTVSVVLGTVDLTGSDTSMAMIAAEALGTPVSEINIAHDNTDTMPYSGGTGGSKTIYTMGPAVVAAAQDARKQILTIASEMIEASVDDLEIKDGEVVVRGVPGKSISFKQIAAASMHFGGRYEPVYGRGRAAVSVSSPMYAAHLAKIAVDPETGSVRVLAYVAAQDVGRAINPSAVLGQIHGGVAQGLGWALYEGLEYDELGQLLTSTLMDYALPHSEDVPTITPILIEKPSGIGPFGAKGVGEPPVIPVGAAVANAIYDAVGVRMEDLPMTPERVFKALQADK